MLRCRTRSPTLLIVLAGLACGGALSSCLETYPTVDGGGASCPTHEVPTFELGTGELSFEPLVPEQDLQMISGPQGGCHVWLALRTDGFAERRFTTAYKMYYADTGDRIIESRETKRLAKAMDRPGECEVVGLAAAVLKPWLVRDHRVLIRVDATDDLDRSAQSEITVTIRWPREAIGIESDLLCGPRG